eukprot:CAMPEP_0170315050 /NCGR_PEP_ID=MMETSP0116_2-20130129/58111_1 /TAXON_ID=400756 /ORGANISM="Durinskia baltica, Strain CSIRO CS-38" /LENGTH=81 /DNA_ID=CAMNT_0010567525 /DNA_START=24 /DNA_END=266 /DNA_ORIENTATION=+
MSLQAAQEAVHILAHDSGPVRGLLDRPGAPTDGKGLALQAVNDVALILRQLAPHLVDLTRPVHAEHIQHRLQQVRRGPNGI